MAGRSRRRDLKQEEKRMDTSARIYQDLDRILVTREQIAQAVKTLGQKITEDYQGRDLMMVCILKGASIFFTDLIREVDLPVSVGFMAVSSYGSGTSSTGVVRIMKDLDQNIEGKDVLIVEDIVDSGKTLNFLLQVLAQRHPASLSIATLLDKPARRVVDLTAKYFCFNIPDAFVVGYGLDYDEKYRNLPDIGVLKPAVYGGK